MSVRSDLKLDLVDGAAVDEADVGVGGHRVGATRGHQLEAVQDSGEEEEQLVLGEALEVRFELLSLGMSLSMQSSQPIKVPSRGVWAHLGYIEFHR